MSGNEHRSVMRDAFQSVVDRFRPDAERLVMFTTFNFSARFFEANILPLLAGDTATELKGVSEVRRALNEELRKVRCLVVCDRSTRPEPKGDMRYGLLPVGLPNGRFHPKLMLMAGTLKESGQPGLYLFVGSGNLSLSGWALNREIVAVTPVASQHARQLALMLRWLLSQAHYQFGMAPEMAEEGAVRDVLSSLLSRLEDRQQHLPAYQGMPTLHLALPFERRESLLDILAGESRWDRATLVAPFWSEVDRLVSALGVSKCRFVPSMTKAGTYAFPISTLSESVSLECDFGKFGDERYTHAKAMLLEREGGQVYCIGSANFTSAALSNVAPPSLANVEAVLRFELPPDVMPWESFAALDRSQIDDAAGMAEEEQPPPLPPIDAAVYYDWKEGLFKGQLTVLDNCHIGDIVLEIGGAARRFSSQPGICQTLPPVPHRCDRPVRSFVVRWCGANGAHASFYGLVTQVNGTSDQLQYAPQPRLDKVLEILRGLNPHRSEEQTRRLAAHNSAESGGDGEEETPAPSFDYFGLFQATWKLRNHYRQLAAAGKTIAPFDAMSPYSIETLYRAVTLQPVPTPEAQIGKYIQLAEVGVLMAAFEEEGYVPSEDSTCRGLRAELEYLLGPIREALGQSMSFNSMFGGSAPDQVQAFLEWFHRELKQEGNNHG